MGLIWTVITLPARNDNTKEDKFQLVFCLIVLLVLKQVHIFNLPFNADVNAQ